MCRVALLAAASLAILPLYATSAAAAPVEPDRDATATVRIPAPASYRKLQDLHFAYLGVTAAGTATIDPNTDTMTTTGGVTHLGGLPYAALFTGISPGSNIVIIRIPKQPITLTRAGGTETMTVSNWTLSGDARRTVVIREPFEFKVGGTLNVNAGQVEGTYVGTFTVDVQYP